MSVKTKQRAARVKEQQDSISREREAEESAEKKILHVWKCFDQVYGKRWTENFGNDPCGKYKDAAGVQNPRMELWLDTVKYMSWPDLNRTIRKISNAPKESEWWLPDLQSFKQYARSTVDRGPVVEREPEVSWVVLACNMYLFRTLLSHGPFSPESLQEMKSAMYAVRDVFEMMRLDPYTTDVPSEARQEKMDTETAIQCQVVKDEIREKIRAAFARLKVRPPTPEESRQMTLHCRSPRPRSPTRASLSLPTPTGNLALEEPSNSV